MLLRPSAQTSASRSPSPNPSCSSESSAEASGSRTVEEHPVTCKWNNCGLVFTQLSGLIEHIHELHVGTGRQVYSCEWTGCNRFGVPQTARFSIIAHIRSHTGEKPYTCERPECDRSFTRSDALAKHMRQQHNALYTSRKRKQPDTPRQQQHHQPEEHQARSASRGTPSNQYSQNGSRDTNPQAPAGSIYKHSFIPYAWNSNSGHIHSAAMHASHGAGFSSFKVEAVENEALLQTGSGGGGGGGGGGAPAPEQQNGRGPNSSRRPSPSPSPIRVDPGAADSESEDEGIPPHLRNAMDQETGLIIGRSPAMVKYLLMKAKHKYALDEHDHLIEELRVARTSLSSWKAEKEHALDRVLSACFGPDANDLIAPIPVPSGYHERRGSRSPTRR